jgi:acetyl esterase/lipase
MDRNRALLQKAETFAYKSVGGKELDAYLFQPASAEMESPRAAIVFFFSGNWESGQLSQFAPHCLYFAHRGMVAVLADYRVASRHNSTPMDALSDARTAVRWLRFHAQRFNIDPARIVAAGGAAGACLAAGAAMIDGFDDPADDLAISPRPDALVLFNPFLDTTLMECGLERFPDKKVAKLASPMHHIRRKLPAMLIIHGTADRVVPFESSRKFASKNRWRRNPVRLAKFDGQGHGFFNLNVDPTAYEQTISLVDSFLVERGFLASDPEADSGLRLG